MNSCELVGIHNTAQPACWVGGSIGISFRSPLKIAKADQNDHSFFWDKS